jgi:hypothetical protein
VVFFCWSRKKAVAPAVSGARKDLGGEGVDDGDAGDGDAMGECHNDVAPGFDVDGRVVDADAGKAREAAESRFEG